MYSFNRSTISSDNDIDDSSPDSNDTVWVFEENIKTIHQ